MKKLQTFVSIPILSLMLGCVCTSIGPFFVEFSSQDSITNTFYRLLIGGLFFSFLSFIKDKSKPSKKTLLLCFFAAIAFTLDLCTWTQGVLSIGPGLSTVLGNLEVVFLVFIGFLFFKEKFSSLFIKNLILIFFGIFLLLTPYLKQINFHEILGISLAISSSFFYAIYLMLIKEIGVQKDQISTSSMLCYICLMGAALLFILMILSPNISLSINGGKSFIFMFFNAVFSQILGWMLITRGIKKVKLSVSGVILLTQPALTFLFDGTFFKRNTHLLQIIGCIVLLFSIYIAMREAKK